MKEKIKKQKMWGIYDEFRKELIYVYKDQDSAINQGKRGSSNWKLVEIETTFDSNKKASFCNCCCR